MIEKRSRLGKVDISWKEIDPGFVLIQTNGGSLYERHIAYYLSKANLISDGYLVVEDLLPLDEFHKRIASWADVQRKGIRLYQEGNVNLLRNGYHEVFGLVKGDDPSTEVEVKDHHRVYPPPPKPQQTYETWFTREDPNSRALTQSGCSCKWSQFRFDRNFGKGRQGIDKICSHILALYYQSQATPLDEDIHPVPSYRKNPQQRLFTPSESPEIATFPADREILQAPTEPAMMPESFQEAPYNELEQAPPQLSLIPPSRKEMADMIVQAPFSTPDLNPPNPSDPFGGSGTFSSLIRSSNQYAYQPGDIVRLNVPTYAQKERGAGYSTTGEWHEQGTDAGEWIEIPRNSQGTVFDYDKNTGYVAVDFPLKGPAMSSYYARAWFNASEVNFIR